MIDYITFIQLAVPIILIILGLSLIYQNRHFKEKSKKLQYMLMLGVIGIGFFSYISLLVSIPAAFPLYLLLINLFGIKCIEKYKKDLKNYYWLKRASIITLVLSFIGFLTFLLIGPNSISDCGTSVCIFSGGFCTIASISLLVFPIAAYLIREIFKSKSEYIFYGLIPIILILAGLTIFVSGSTHTLC